MNATSIGVASRRTFLGTLTVVLGSKIVGRAVVSESREPIRSFAELGIRPFINAGEPYTSLSGAPMHEEVEAALQYASKQQVRLLDVQNAVGKRLGELLGCEAAMVTAGASSAITLGTAACITRGITENVQRLPDCTGLRNVVLIQKAHRFVYEQAVRNTGAILVEVETKEEIERAINDRTAMLLFNNRQNELGTIRDSDFVRIGKQHEVPTFNDCASDVPPASNLRRYTAMGFDLVCFSGGKGLRGPSSSGLLLGSRDLIDAAKRNTSPYDDTLGRGMKVGKEEMIGILVAVECALREGNDVSERYEQRLDRIAARVSQVRGVSAELFTPRVSYRTPHLRVTWAPEEIKITPDEVRHLLREGSPSIETRTGPDPVRSLELTAWLLKPGEADIVAVRLKEILQNAASTKQ